MSATNLPSPLTAKEKMVLEFVETFIIENGIAPSFLEIKNHFGFASYNSVQRYLKQLQKKSYIHLPGGNQKRAITVLHSANAVQDRALKSTSTTPPNAILHSHPFVHPNKEEAPLKPQAAESLSLPLLGRVAAGQPIEAVDHDEYIDTPASMVRHPHRSFALKVEGQSMIEDGILDGDVILIQKQPHAHNGDIVVATVENEATVKRFYLHKDKVELRPANSEMAPMWFSPEQVEVKGIVVGLIRNF